METCLGQLTDNTFKSIFFTQHTTDKLFSTSFYDFKPNHTYLFKVKNPHLNPTQISGNYIKFQIRCYHPSALNNGYDFVISQLRNDTDLSTPIPEYIEYTTPDDITRMYIAMNASAGEEETIHIYDITEQTRIYDSIDWELNTSSITQQRIAFTDSTTSLTTTQNLIYYQKCSANDIFKIETNQPTIDIYYCEEIPISQNIKLTRLNKENYYTYTEYILTPSPGYICYILNDSQFCKTSKKKTYLSTNDIIPYRQTDITFTLISHIAINAAINSNTFGQTFEHSNNTYKASDFIDISGAYAVNIPIFYVTSSVWINVVAGAVFYDSDKQPISVASTLIYTDVYKKSQNIIKVHDNAQFIRLTTSQDSITLFYKDYDIKDYDIYETIFTDDMWTKVNPELLPLRTYYLNTHTLIVGNNTIYKHILLDVSDAQFVKMIPNPKSSTNNIWLTSDKEFKPNTTPDILENSPVFNFREHNIQKVPLGAKFMYIYLSSDIELNMPLYLATLKLNTNNNSSESVNYTDKRKTEYALRSSNIQQHYITEIVKNDWEKPKSVQVENILKKALQMINIRWTPKKNYPLPPSGSTKQWAYANTEYTHGIPYSNNNSRFKRVGLEVSIHTFMTAVNNPYSLVYTEKVDDADHYSDWGEEYYTTNGTGYYGTVCCAFTSAVLGIKFNVGNGTHYKSSKAIGLFTTLSKNLTKENINELEFGDVADDEKHSLLIFGIHRDSNGKVDQIKYAEATGSGGSYMGCRLVTQTAEQFINKINTAHTGQMTLFRYSALQENIKYEPSPYVPLSEYNEVTEPVVYNNDICTFAGDKATFMKGDLVVINYNLNNEDDFQYDTTNIYKDDVLLQSYKIADINNDELPLSQQNHALNLGKALEPGKYKANMSNISGLTSDYTYWEVLDGVNTYITNDGTVTITGISNKIAYVMCGKIGYEKDYPTDNYMFHGFWHGNVCIPPTIYEYIDNQMTFNPVEFRMKYNYYKTNTTHIVVMMEGDYGLAPTMPINIAETGNETNYTKDNQGD